MTITRESPKIEYAVPEAARLLGYSARWLYKEIAAGRVATITDAETGYLRITSTELERFKATIKTGPADAERRRRWRIERARSGGYGKRAKHTASEIAAPLQEGLRRAIENRVDPDGTLRASDPDDFRRRCETERLNQLSRARKARWT